MTGAAADARNLRAQRLLERLGFRREGELQESVWFKRAWANQRHSAACPAFLPTRVRIRPGARYY
jgi:RimJ/RimL family protein N-acetyltransferase